MTITQKREYKLILSREEFGYLRELLEYVVIPENTQLEKSISDWHKRLTVILGSTIEEER